MKNSIKREKSHARMSFAEYENQRSLAEGESNVRATLKHMKLSFHLILTFAVMLTMAQSAWAVTEEVTETWTMNGSACSISGSTLSNGSGNRIVLSNGGGWLNNGKQTILDVNQALILTNQYSMEASFPDIEGTVTKVEFHNICLYCPTSYSMYVGKDMSNLLSISPGVTAFSSWDNAGQFKDVTYTGTLDVSSSAPLKLLFGASSVPPLEMLLFDSGYIKVTYQREVAADPQHTFSFPNPSSFSGNTLTATCVNNSAGHECTLTNRQATLTLTAHDNTIESFPMDYPSLNLLEFNTQTGLGATAGTITYTNKATGNSQTGMIFETGEFTASVTVTVGGNNYTLTKDFNILAGYRVNNNYLQFSLSKSSALVGDEITITYTQLMNESLDELTLTGATSGNSIAYTQSGNTYTFTMPAEDVNLNATITYTLNENDITKNGDTYTIKTAEGWDYFCQRILFDKSIDGFKGKTIELANDITVTATMAGNSEHRFKGTFDGKGYALTFNPTSVGQYTAPFYCTDGATIRNLHATGCIQAGDFQNCGGMVGLANGNLTIENCRVSTQISTTYSGNAGHGGFVGFLTSQYNQCHITGCVFDGLIYNPYYSGTTYGCGGFIGAMSEYGYAILEDCLFIHGQYDNNNGKHELWWGNENDKNSTFLRRTNNQGEGTLTNCFYVGTRGLKQGSPAEVSTTAPTNFAHFGDPTTDYGFLKVYGHTMVLDNKYYTPIYGDLVETYDYSGGKSYNIEYDDKPLGIPDITTQLWVPLLRYKRTFTNGKPVTVMMPFNFTKSAFKKSGSSDGLTGHFYEFKGIHLDPQTSKWVAVMGEPDNPETTTMKANTPYLYVPDDEPQYWYIDNGGSGVNIFTEGYDGGNKVTPYDGFEMRGTYTEKVWEENDPEIGKAYLIGDGGELIPVTAGTKIRPTECYIIQTAWATDKTLSGSESYTAQDGDVLTGSTSGTVTIANNAKITLSDVTITGGIVCAGTAEITLVGMNSVTGASQKAGIQVGGSFTTLTIKGNGSLTANGGDQSAGIGLSRAWKPANDVIGGDIIIEGGNITANGSVNGQWGAGIGTGVIYYGNGSAKTARIGNITIKGGSVKATGGSEADGIGTGYTYYGCTNTIGTVTIYDGIDKVDASSISESVTYMHVENETETDVTANKSDYFSIIEDGNRRVIAPKDDTDYTITIANGIEHGTLEGAATAKYMEKVTITATPALGYRFSRLVVKDAQNNDVASTDNSFFMPKSNVTVSAVFEQATHGTTEFAWGYIESGVFVTEATIYDGVTTVNLQQGKEYFIGKDYQESPEPGMGYYENTFRLDEDPYTEGRNIPYSGGTGSFMMGGYGKFRLNGDAGYYDITMTDVGNGKWSVSILKTVGVIDNIPDQTYSGSAITPEPLVLAGSLSLTKGTDYVYSYTNNTNVGTAKVRATFQGNYASLGYVEKEFTILPSTVMVSVTGSGTVTCGDRSATDGTSFGVMSEKGASVVLTLTPGNGYAVRSVEYGYTNSNEMTTNGAKLPINGTTATLTVPDDLKDGTYVNLTVTFVSALVGGADEVSAVALTDNTLTDLAGGWYKVDSNITFDHTLNLLGDTHLIIDDGKTMTVNTASNRGIYSDYTLFVRGDGALSVTTTADDGIAVCVGNYVQTGATVTASGYIGIRCTDDFIAFNFDNDFTFSGGQLTATGNSRGIRADNNITLSCTNATDFIQASSYRSVYGAVKIADGKALTDGTEASNGMNGYSGTLTNEQITAIGGKTLRRAVTTSYVDATGTLHENVVAIPLDNTMTTLAAGWYVVNENVDYTGQITISGNVNIILADGKTMTVTNTGTGNEDFAIYGDGPLTIYGQALGTGILTVTSTNDVGIRVVDGVTINGGSVNAKGIYADGDITINGGKVTNNSDPGIRSNNGTIILGLSNATDYITAESYNGAVKVADGQTLVDDGGNIWSGTLDNDQIENGINGRTLRPVMGVVLTKDGSGNISAEFNGTSLETVSIPVNITVNSVTLNRTFTHQKSATLMLPFSLSKGQTLNGGTLYKFDGVNNGEGDWVATLSEFTSPLKANTPYLIKPNGHMTDDKITFDLNGGTVTLNTTTAGEDSNEKDDLWDFIGTYSYIKWTTVTGDQDYSAEREAEIGKVYGFAAVEKTGIHVGDFVRVASGAKIRPMCAYLKWKGSIPNNARALTRSAAADEELPQRITVKLVSASGETTAIGTLDTTTGEVSFDSEAWYTLDGVRLSGKPSKKGIYINNGKKVVIKDSQSAFTKCND